jgi:hypothetical protein
MKTSFCSQATGYPGSGWRVHSILPLPLFAASLLVLALGSSASRGSDPVGVFALIDKVVIEPNENKPERIVIWGTFAVADGERGRAYKSPEKGYLYFYLSEADPKVARMEWMDLKNLAGKNEVIGFGTRYGEPARVRQAGEKPKNADVYRTGFGLVRMNRRPASYPPVKAILEAAGKTKSKTS